mmetsp:Transcript_16116/g.25123  ORF Transcript_16116/g.25123 Transcript_16116/m.25123 type:complete len:108 (-) Transcript_16116:493-816(-)
MHIVQQNKTSKMFSNQQQSIYQSLSLRVCLFDLLKVSQSVICCTTNNIAGLPTACQVQHNGKRKKKSVHKHVGRLGKLQCSFFLLLNHHFMAHDYWLDLFLDNRLRR